MGTPTADELISIRRQVGLAPTDAEVAEIYDHNDDDVDETVLEILEIRAAEMRRNPLSFTVPGEYGESRNINQLEALEDQIGALGGGETGLGVVTVVEPSYRHTR